MGKGLARLAVESGEALVAVGAGALAIVTADAELLVDEEDVGRLADAVLDQKAGHARVIFDRAREARFLGLDEIVDGLAARHVLLGLGEQSRFALEQAAEGEA